MPEIILNDQPSTKRMTEAQPLHTIYNYSPIPRLVHLPYWIERETGGTVCDAETRSRIEKKLLERRTMIAVRNQCVRFLNGPFTQEQLDEDADIIAGFERALDLTFLQPHDGFETERNIASDIERFARLEAPVKEALQVLVDAHNVKHSMSSSNV